MALRETRPAAPLELVRQLEPLIRASAGQVEAERALPRPLFEALADAGLFLLLVPRSLGGAELEPLRYLELLEALARIDASTAWCVNQGAGFATYAAYLPRDLARHIWIDTPRSVVANTPLSDAVARPVAGGFRVTGRLSFGTGCQHAAWLAARATVLDGQQPRLLADGQPDSRYFLVPAQQGRIVDTWRVQGMRGTGTHHFEVDDVLVPEARSFSPAISPPIEPGPLYLIPRTNLFAAGDAATALGVARGSLEAFVELATGKAPTNSPSLLRDQPMVQAEIGQAEATLRSARALLFEALGEAWNIIRSSGALPLAHRADLRLASTHALRLAVQVVDAVYHASGTTAIYQGNPIQRRFQDIHVISQHIQARRSYYELLGRHYLGLAVDPERL